MLLVPKSPGRVRISQLADARQNAERHEYCQKQGPTTLHFQDLVCDTVDMKNITVSIDEEAYRRARIRAAEQGISVSAAVREFLVRFAGEETDFDRRKRLQNETFASVEDFRAGDRLTREDVHNRALR